MRKLISMAAVALLFVGATSCSQNEPKNPEETGAGNVTITLALTGEEGTRAVAPSTVKPNTTWAKVGPMMVLFVGSDDKVKDARAIAAQTGSAILPQTFTGVKAGLCDIYIVSNYPQGGDDGWNAGNVVGKTINDQLKIALKEIPVGSIPDASLLTAEAGSKAYPEAPEVFVAKKANVTIPNNGTNLDLTAEADHFKLARAVSLIRIRIDQNHADALANANIDFTAGKAVFAVRRATTTYGIYGSYSYLTETGSADGIMGNTFPAATFTGTADSKNVFMSAKALSDAEPTSATHSAGPGGAANKPIIAGLDIDLWQEYLIWAGGGKPDQPSKKFDIVLSGLTKDNSYVALGKTTPEDPNTRVYWTGAVDAVVGPNQILELVLTLKTAGSVDTPPVGQYGGLDIEVELVGWGNIIGTEMDL